MNYGEGFTIYKDNNLLINKKMFLSISIMQIMIASLPLIIVLSSIINGEWGNWQGFATETWIVSFRMYTVVSMIFMILSIFISFNPIYKKSSLVVFISTIICYILNTGAYGPRFGISLLIIRAISEQLWVAICVLLIGILLKFIFSSYLYINTNNYYKN